ncbi:MAG: hypothetical protein ACI38A_07350 [Candidatus Ornithomonoglobus sp.]
MANNPSVSNPTGNGTTASNTSVGAPKPPNTATVNNTTISGDGTVTASAPKTPSVSKPVSTTITGEGNVIDAASIPKSPTQAKFGNTTITGEGSVIGFTPSPQTAASPSSSSDPLVGARDYYKAGALGGNVDWDGQNVLLDGNAVTPSYIRNGTAYIPKSVADTAIDQHNITSGITGNQGVLSKTDTKDKGRTEAALNALLTREDFNYNPETDPVYQQHAAMQERYANDAMRYILNMNNSSPFGASAGVLGEALATRDNYIRGLSEDEKTYRDDAYTRYTDKTQSMRDNLTDVRDVLTDFYNREYQANRDAIGDTMANTKAEREAEQQEFENQQTAKINDAQVEAQNISNRKGTIDLDTYGAMNDAKLAAQQEENKQLAFDNGTRAASTLGRFFESDESWLPELKNFREIDPITGEWTGRYTLGPWDSEVKYTQAMKAAEQSQNVVGTAVTSALGAVNPDGTPVTGSVPVTQNSQVNGLTSQIYQAALEQALKQIQSGTTAGSGAIPAAQGAAAPAATTN